MAKCLLGNFSVIPENTIASCFSKTCLGDMQKRNILRVESNTFELKDDIMIRRKRAQHIIHFTAYFLLFVLHQIQVEKASLSADF